MAPHSSTLAWKIPWAEEPGGLQSMGSLRVGHDWATSLSLFTFMHWRRKWQPTPVFLPGESQGRGSLMPAVYGVAQSRTRLKRLSSSSSLHYCSKDRVQPSTGPWFEFKVSSKHNYMVFRKVFYQYPSTLWVSCIPLLASLLFCNYVAYNLSAWLNFLPYVCNPGP